MFKVKEKKNEILFVRKLLLFFYFIFSNLDKNVKLKKKSSKTRKIKLCSIC